LYNAAKALSCRNMRAMVLEGRGSRSRYGARAVLQQSHLANNPFPLLEGVAALHVFPDDADPKKGDRPADRG